MCIPNSNGIKILAFIHMSFLGNVDLHRITSNQYSSEFGVSAGTAKYTAIGSSPNLENIGIIEY